MASVLQGSSYSACLPAQGLRRVRDALTLLCLGVPFRNDLVELSLV